MEEQVSASSAETISIQEAQALLQQIESENMRVLGSRLSPVRESAMQSLRKILYLADDMGREKIKLEGLEQRYKSIVENSRKTVVSSLRREASTELELPNSVNDAKKFKEKFEAMMSRFGEVTGSHSKVLNNFMKKYSNQIKEEFEELQKLLSETKNVLSEFEQRRSPTIKCSNLLNTCVQKTSSIKAGESQLAILERQISEGEQDLEKTKAEVAALKSSADFSRAAAVVENMKELENRESELRDQMRDLFLHVSRAFTKYSYGVSKETERRLHLMSSESWQLLYEPEISPYLSLLVEIRKSINSGKIQVKDSDKMVHYLDLILHSLPENQKRAQELKQKANAMRLQDSELVRISNELEEKIVHQEEYITKARQEQERQKRENAEKRAELDTLLAEAGDILVSIAGKRYSLSFG